MPRPAITLSKSWPAARSARYARLQACGGGPPSSMLQTSSVSFSAIRPSSMPLQMHGGYWRPTIARAREETDREQTRHPRAGRSPVIMPGGCTSGVHAQRCRRQSLRSVSSGDLNREAAQVSFVRVATYAVQSGNTAELVRRVNETLVPLYREQRGFESLSIVDAGDYIVSISRWDSDQHAREGAEIAIAWAKQQTDLIAGPPSTSHFGTEVVSVAVS